MTQNQIFERHTQGEEIEIVTLVTKRNTDKTYDCEILNVADEVIKSYFGWSNRELMIDAATDFANENDYFIDDIYY